MKGFLRNNVIRGVTLSVFVLTFLMTGIGIVGANGTHLDEDQSLVFPEWTYYAETIEHGAMLIIAIITILLLIKPYRKHENEVKESILWLIIGLVMLALSQLLTNLHHFLIFPFGIWNAIIHHGLLMVSVVVMIIAFFKLLKGVKR